MKQAVKDKDKDNWFTWLQLGLNIFITKDYERAEVMLQKSIECMQSPWALYVLAILYRDTGEHQKEVEHMMRAWNMIPYDVSLAKATLRCLYENKCFADLRNVYESMPEVLRSEPRCRVYYAFSLVHDGYIKAAETILYDNGGLLIPDLRECETITLDLWIAIQEAKGESTENPPRFVDFRMFTNLEWLNGGEII